MLTMFLKIREHVITLRGSFATLPVPCRDYVANS